MTAIAPVSSFIAPAAELPVRRCRPFADRAANRLLPLLAPLALLLIWQLSARLDLLPPQIMPSPHAVLLAIRDSIASGDLQANLGKTLLWLLEGYAAGAVLALAIGILIGLSQTASDYIYPSFKAIAYVPVFGWLPLWLVLLGVGDALKVVLVAQATLSPIVFNTHDGIRAVPAKLIEVGRVTGLNRRQMLRRIVLPSAFPSIWSGIRFGLTKAWLALVAVELLASTEGLGFMMVNARSLYQLDVMFVSVVAIGLVGFALDRGLEAIEKHVLRWRDAPEVAW
jgi:sulfonate transport system permease protein